MSLSGPDNRGSILISALWIISLLAVLASGIGFRAFLELRLNKDHLDGLRAVYAAKAGLLKAEERLLKRDPAGYDSLYECGITLAEEETLESVFGGEANPLEGGSFSIDHGEAHESGEEKQYGLTDEERKVNINVRTDKPRDVAEFKRIMKGLSRGLTEKTIDAILEWESEGADPFAESAQGAFSQDTASQPQKKSGRFNSIEELSRVKGVDMRVIDRIKEHLTVYGSGKININTAPEKVLAAVLDEDDRYRNLVKKILTYRKGPDQTEGTDDDGHFTDVSGELIRTLELSPEEAGRILSLSGSLTPVSTSFRIVSHGKAGKAARTITEVVDYSGGPEASLTCRYYHES